MEWWCKQTFIRPIKYFNKSTVSLRGNELINIVEAEIGRFNTKPLSGLPQQDGGGGGSGWWLFIFSHGEIPPEHTVSAPMTVRGIRTLHIQTRAIRISVVRWGTGIRPECISWRNTIRMFSHVAQRGRIR